MMIEKDKVVSMHYTLTNNQNEVIDSSIGSEPLEYIQGSGQIISGLESQLEAKKAGDKLKVSVSPENGYGKLNSELIRVFNKEELPQEEELKEGVQFQMDTPDGPIILTITKIDGENVTLDGNHPLAGIDLNFDVEIMSVREATADELSHGHVHGPGCNH